MWQVGSPGNGEFVLSLTPFVPQGVPPGGSVRPTRKIWVFTQCFGCRGDLVGFLGEVVSGDEGLVDDWCLLFL